MNWLELLKVLIGPLTTLAVAYFFGYRMAYRNWLRQKSKEIEYTGKLAAYRAAWSLLAFMSEKENPRTVFVKRGTSDNPQYLLRRKQADDFLAELPKVFFEQGHGILMSKEAKEGLFHFRSLVFRILDAERLSSESQGDIVIKNEHIAREVANIREALTLELRNQVQSQP